MRSTKKNVNIKLLRKKLVHVSPKRFLLLYTTVVYAFCEFTLIFPPFKSCTGVQANPETKQKQNFLLLLLFLLSFYYYK